MDIETEEDPFLLVVVTHLRLELSEPSMNALEPSDLGGWSLTGDCVDGPCGGALAPPKCHSKSARGVPGRELTFDIVGSDEEPIDPALFPTVTFTGERSTDLVVEEYVLWQDYALEGSWFYL